MLRRMTCAPKSRSGRAALRAAQTLPGTSRTIATGRTSCSRATRPASLRASALHVGRVHDGQPPAPQPLAGDVVQEVEGVGGRGLVVLVIGDQAAAEVGRDDLGRRKCSRGEGRLAGAGGADQDDQAQLGDLESVTRVTARRLPREDGHLGRRPDLRVVRADRQEPRHGSRSARPPRVAQARNCARVHSKRWSRCRAARRQVLEAHVVLGVRRGHDDRPRAAAPKTTRSSAASRGGSTCSMTSIRTAAPGPPASLRGRSARTGRS